MIIECWTPQSSHRDTFFSIYLATCIPLILKVSVVSRITCILKVDVRFEAWAKLAQQWLVRGPLGIHLEPIKLLVTI